MGADVGQRPSVSHRHPAISEHCVGAVSRAVPRRGKLLLLFIEKNVKINVAYYKTEVVEKVVTPALRDLYGEDIITFFQQDGASAHAANFVQA